MRSSLTSRVRCLSAPWGAGTTFGDVRLAHVAANRIYLLLERPSQPESPGNFTEELI